MAILRLRVSWVRKIHARHHVSDMKPIVKNPLRSKMRASRNILSRARRARVAAIRLGVMSLPMLQLKRASRTVFSAHVKSLKSACRRQPITHGKDQARLVPNFGCGA